MPVTKTLRDWFTPEQKKQQDKAWEIVKSQGGAK